MIRIFKSAFLVASVLASFIACEGSIATELVNVKGKVAVSQGDGFQAASGKMVLKPGDKVLLGQDGAASVVYAKPRCVVQLVPATVTTITRSGPCLPGQTTMIGHQSVVITPTADPILPPAYPPAFAPALTPFFVMGGAAIIGSGVSIISETTGEGDGGSGSGGSISDP